MILASKYHGRDGGFAEKWIAAAAAGTSERS